MRGFLVEVVAVDRLDQERVRLRAAEGEDECITEVWPELGKGLPLVPEQAWVGK